MGKIAFQFYFFRYKVFFKNYHILFYIKDTTNILYKKEIREQKAKQTFLLHQVYKVPKEGHFCAKVRALLRLGKSTFATGKISKKKLMRIIVP